MLSKLPNSKLYNLTIKYMYMYIATNGRHACNLTGGAGAQADNHTHNRIVHMTKQAITERPSSRLWQTHSYNTAPESD